jgi:signal transduction histidine kinase
LAVIGRRFLLPQQARRHGRLEALARRRLPRAAVDLLLAPLLAVAALTQAVDPAHPTGHGLDAVGIALAVMVGAPFAVHRRWPVAALLVVGAAAAALQARHSIPAPVAGAGATIGTVLLAVAVAVFLTTVRSGRCPTHRLLAGTALAAGGTQVLIGRAGGIGSALVVDVLVVAAWALGCLVRARHAMAAEALEHAAALKREQVALARTAVVEERARIARELHDIVAHHVSLMIVQVIAADRVQTSNPGKTRELHAAIEATGRAPSQSCGACWSCCAPRRTRRWRGARRSRRSVTSPHCWTPCAKPGFAWRRPPRVSPAACRPAPSSPPTGWCRRR